MTEDKDDSEIEKQEESKNQTTLTSAEQHNKNLRVEWYKFSTGFIPAKYKLQYVRANAKNRNEEIIFEWYDECEKVGLIPDELQLIPEDSKPTIENQPVKKKSFHR